MLTKGCCQKLAISKCILTIAGCYYIDKKSGREYQYNLTSGELLSLTSVRDASFIRLMYDSSKRVEKIVHSSGAYIDVAYDVNGRIISANLQNSTEIDKQSV